MVPALVRNKVERVLTFSARSREEGGKGTNVPASSVRKKGGKGTNKPYAKGVERVLTLGWKGY